MPVAAIFAAIGHTLMFKKYIPVAVLLIALSSCAQKKYWHHKNPLKGKSYGVAIKDAYKKVAGKPSKQIVVAVIDIGTDINHPFLKPYIWTNSKEIAGNGKDDDGNGYVDDIHGWNFIGGANGENLMYEATEETRAWQAIERKFADKDTLHLAAADTAEFNVYKKLRAQYKKEQRERESDARAMEAAAKMSKKWFWRQVFVIAAGKNAPHQIEEGRRISVAMALYNKLDADSLRRTIIGDDPDNLQERYYGNNDVTGPDASHGTHVAGIIAAMHNDELVGVKGISNNVRIMPIRTIPWADERDKDVANAIRYAVDNGATIINMSFGKTMSLNKDVVDEAIAYAASKDVLLIHGSGNESTNTTKTPGYPNPNLQDGGYAENWLEIGASGRKKGKKLAAGFSNYGKSTVDMFAPGVKIYATLPGNKYGYEDGTSMASPVSAGVAVLIRSYFPHLNAEQVKAVMMKSTMPYIGDVRIPGHKKNYIGFKELSISGGVVNADRAVSSLLK